MGLIMVLSASLLSGLSAALTQKALVGSKPRHPLFFSAELAVYGIIFLIVRSLFSSESKLILSGDLFAGWTPYTLIPVTLNVSSGPPRSSLELVSSTVITDFPLRNSRRLVA